MKGICKLLLAILSVVLYTTDSMGQIPGKIYQPGDSIIIDGMSCLVYKVDDTGMHGTVMSPYMVTPKVLEKDKKKTIKDIEKEIKKGKATQEDLDVALAHYNTLKKFPVITREREGKGTIYKVDEWSKQIPEGWRIPSTKDAEEFATFYCGGIGKEHGIKFKFLAKAYELTTAKLTKSNLLQVANYGIIVSDSNQPKDVKFLPRYWNKRTGNMWFELKDKFVGTELTVAVKDF